MNIHRTLVILTLSLFFSSVYANPYQSSPPSPRVMQQSPTVVLKKGIEHLTEYLASGSGKNKPPLDVFLENTIAPLFDFEYMAKWVAGAQARNMTPPQVLALKQKVRRLFMTGMVDKLVEYRHGRVQFLRPVGNPQTGEITLRLIAYQQGNYRPQRLKFRMYHSPRGWKVFDISADGQSIVALFRTQFAHEARQRRWTQNNERRPVGYHNN